jgi:hypothetical protein
MNVASIPPSCVHTCMPRYVCARAHFRRHHPQARTHREAQRVEGGGGSRTRRDHAHELARVSARQIRQAQRPPGPPLACT